jgi:hypothetical protein
MLYIIVKQHEFETYDRLHRSFGDRAPVVWDRRRARRRPPAGSGTNPDAGERRQAPPTSWSLGFVVVDRPA